MAKLSPRSAIVTTFSKEVHKMTELKAATAARVETITAMMEASAGAAGPSNSQRQDLQHSRNKDTGLMAVGRARSPCIGLHHGG